MGPPKGSVPDMDERRASGETKKPLRLLIPERKLTLNGRITRIDPLYLSAIIRFELSLEVFVKNTYRPIFLTKEESNKLEDSACLASVTAVLDEEYAKPFNEQDQARLDEAWATFEKLTGIKTSFTPEEIDVRIKAIMERVKKESTK